MKRLLLALFSVLVLAGCSTPRGGTSDVYEETAYESVDETTEARPSNDFGRGTDRFSQESTQMLSGAEPDVKVFRQ